MKKRDVDREDAVTHVIEFTIALTVFVLIVANLINYFVKIRNRGCLVLHFLYHHDSNVVL